MKTSNWTKLNKRYDWLYFHEGVFDFAMFEKFVAENGFVSVRKGRGTCTLKWFLQNGRDVPFKAYPRQREAVSKILGNHLPRPELADHDHYYKLPSGECVYVSQPYVSKEIAEPIVMGWARKLGVKAKVYDGSYAWYNTKDKDEICLIVISLPDRDVKVYNGSENCTAEKQENCKGGVDG